METQTIVLLIILWLLCGLLSYGWSLSAFQELWSELPVHQKAKLPQHRIKCFYFSLAGIVALLSALIMRHYKYGWRL